MSVPVIKQVVLRDPTRRNRLITARPHIARVFWPWSPKPGWRWHCDSGIAVGMGGTPVQAYENWLRIVWNEV